MITQANAGELFLRRHHHMKLIVVLVTVWVSAVISYGQEYTPGAISGYSGWKKGMRRTLSKVDTVRYTNSTNGHVTVTFGGGIWARLGGAQLQASDGGVSISRITVTNPRAGAEVKLTSPSSITVSPGLNVDLQVTAQASFTPTVSGNGEASATISASASSGGAPGGSSVSTIIIINETTDQQKDRTGT